MFIIIIDYELVIRINLFVTSIIRLTHNKISLVIILVIKLFFSK